MLWIASLESASVRFSYIVNCCRDGESSTSFSPPWRSVVDGERWSQLPPVFVVNEIGAASVLWTVCAIIDLDLASCAEPSRMCGMWGSLLRRLLRSRSFVKGLL